VLSLCVDSDYVVMVLVMWWMMMMMMMRLYDEDMRKKEM